MFLFSQLYLWPFEFCKHVRDRAGVVESIAGVSGRSALGHFEFTDVIFGMRVPDTATVFQFWSYQRCICFLFHFFFTSIQSLLIYLYTGFVVMAFYVCFALIFIIRRIINEYLLTITVVITISVTFLCTDFTCFFARSAFLNLILHS